VPVVGLGVVWGVGGAGGAFECGWGVMGVGAVGGECGGGEKNTQQQKSNNKRYQNNTKENKQKKQQKKRECRCAQEKQTRHLVTQSKKNRHKTKWCVVGAELVYGWWVDSSGVAGQQ